jgi:hypothetical protein
MFRNKANINRRKIKFSYGFLTTFLDFRLNVKKSGSPVADNETDGNSNKKGNRDYGIPEFVVFLGAKRVIVTDHFLPYFPGIATFGHKSDAFGGNFHLQSPGTNGTPDKPVFKKNFLKSCQLFYKKFKIPVVNGCTGGIPGIILGLAHQ